MAFILLTILIDVIGFGIIIPVLPSLVEQLTGRGPSEGAYAFGWLLASFGIMQFLFAPVLGNLSDRFGRRPILLLSLAFAGVDYVVQALAPNLLWLFIGRILAGITGASFTAASAYIADVSPPEKRAQNFGMIGATFGLGFILGPALGGVLAAYGPRVPFWAAAGLTFLNFLYGYFVLPESLSLENRREFDWRTANPFAALGILGRHRWILMLGLAASLLWIGQQAGMSTWVLYTSYRFGWDETDNGLSLALLGASMMFVQLWLIRFLGKRMKDAQMLSLAMVLNVAGLLAMGLAFQSWMLIAAMLLWTMAFIGGPTMQGMVSTQYGPDEQGAINGAMSALQNLTGVVGPILMTSIFGYFTSKAVPIKVPSMPFYVGTGLAAVSALAVRYALTHRPAPRAN